MTITLPTNIDRRIASLVDTIAKGLGLTNLTMTEPRFRLELECPDGQSLYAKITQLGSGDSNSSSPPTEGMLNLTSLSMPLSGGANADVSFGTAVLVASTIDVTPDVPPDGVAVPSGSSIYATVTTAAGVVKTLKAVRKSDTQITISSVGTGAAAATGYKSLLAADGVDGTLVDGTVDIALANVVNDVLVAKLKTSHGTAGVLSVKRKSATEVTVESWLAATGIQVLDLSDVTVFNLTQLAHETSTVRYAIVRP